MEPRVEFLLRMGDNTLVLGHRVSEWCGHAPVLEEDIALANTALDLIGQTQLWLGLAGEVLGCSADHLAMRRDAWEFRNLLLVEQPNGDFGRTMMRQYLFDAWHVPMLTALSDHGDAQIAAIARKAVKEAAYHLERSRETVIALGDGTDESHSRMQAALERLWPFVGEMFDRDEIDEAAGAPAQLRDAFDAELNETMALASLAIPEGDFAHRGGRSGVQHSEHLGHMLTQMQWLQRAYPDATW